MAIYLFAGHSLDPERRELRRGDQVVTLEPQVFDLLHLLIRHRDRVVGKDQLFAEIWTERIVSESTLSSRISAARRAIGDTGEQQRLIRTFSRKGFRFVADVTEANHAADAEREPAEPPTAAIAPVSPALPGRADRRQLTILSCRFVAAPPSTMPPDPEDLREAMASNWHGASRVVEQHEGLVVTRTADGLLAYFGYPRLKEDDAERAVRAGLAIVSASRERHGGNTRAHVAIGIATGLVVIGDPLGSDVEATTTAVGDAPFTAARMVGLCGPDSVVISAATRELIGELFEYQAASPDDGSDPACRVLRERPTVSRFEALRRGRKELIGREDDLDLLRRRWAQAKGEGGRIVLVAGEAGIGKSHLIAAFRDTLQDEPHGCMRYSCSPHRTQTALYPIGVALEGMAGMDRADDAHARLNKLRELISPFSTSTHDLALLANLLSIPVPDDDPLVSLGSQRRKELLLGLLVAQIERLAAQRPLLIVLEDAHWVDPTTAELIDGLADCFASWPVLLIVTYRPEFDAPWVGQPHATTLVLNRLPPKANAALVRQTAGGKDLPGPLLQRIVAQTDGVPLFIEEVTKSVLESGSLREQGSAYVLADALPELAIPSSLRASLQARLDRMADARAMVQVCAALGREFSYALLRAVIKMTDAELAPLLRRFVASGLVHQRGTIPDAVFVFKHALIQDAAHDTLLRSQRIEVHREIVEAFGRSFADEQARHPELLAYHCAEAGLWEQGIDFLIRAARMACDRSAGVEAQALVDRAARLLGHVASGFSRRQLEGRLEVARGHALVMTRGFAAPEVLAALSRARAVLDESIHPTESLGALCGIFNYHMIRSESPDCLALTEPIFRRRLDRPTAAVVHYMAGTAHLHLGDLGASIEHLEAALARYDEQLCRTVAFVAGYHLRSFILIWLGLAYLYVGRLDRAEETITRAVADARGRSHPFTLVSALLALARFRQHLLDLPGAVAATDEGAAIAAEQRSPYHLSRAGILQALNACDGGRLEVGIARMEQALAAHRATGANFQSSYNLSRLAQAHARLGHFDRALELAEAGIDEVDRSGERWWEAEAHRIKGEILCARNGPGHPEVDACFRAALDTARRQQAPLWELLAAHSLARSWSAVGRHAAACDLLEPACAALEAGQAPPLLEMARQTLQQVRLRAQSGEGVPPGQSG